MPKQNHFSGATLAEAVRNATAAYRRESVLETKRSCELVEIEIELKKNKLSDIADQAERLKQRSEALEREARDKVRDAVVEALIAFSGPLGVLGRVARAIALLSKGSLSAGDVRKLIPAIAAVVAAKDALEALDDFRDARILASQADSLIRSAENVRDDLFTLLKEADDCEPTRIGVS